MALDDKNLSNSILPDSTVTKLNIKSSEIVAEVNEVMSGWGLSGSELAYTRTVILAVLVVGVSFGLWWLSRTIFLRIIHSFAERSKTKWDDYLVENKFFTATAHLVPLLLMDYFMHVVFFDFPRIANVAIRLTDFVIIFVLIIILLRFMNTARQVLSEKPSLKDKPIHSIFQLAKIVVSTILGIVMISIAFNVDLVVVLTSMGAMTAVILLVFKDTILGFVGSIQLATNDMVRIGDWVTMEKFGADGDVLEITLNTVKVQNFDKTITTIPTYSFISDSFKNWRGMQESGGRRVVRSINIELGTIKFCTPEMLTKFAEIELIREYIGKKEDEIVEFNKNNDVNKSVLLNGRNQTNIGIFRHYMTVYLQASPELNQKMTLMVRQLEPSETGVALQVYCFTKTQDWEEYERVISHIFDHLMSSANYFDLAVYESPSSRSFEKLVN